jgi:hypothetical protein
MKTIMKLILAVAALCAIAIQSQASTYNCCEVLLTGGTNFVAPSTVNTLANKVDASKQENIPFEFTFASQDTNVLNVVVTAKASIDGTVVATSGPAFWTWTLIGDGTTARTYTTNMTALGFGKFVVTIQNLNPSVALTNVALRYAIKRTGE